MADFITGFTTLMGGILTPVGDLLELPIVQIFLGLAVASSVVGLILKTARGAKRS